jgi:hypothetical protein
MTVDAPAPLPTRAPAAPRIVHYEHPERIGEAWCGAEVIGIRGRQIGVTCVVCIDLHRARRWRR